MDTHGRLRRSCAQAQDLLLAQGGSWEKPVTLGILRAPSSTQPSHCCLSLADLASVNLLFANQLAHLLQQLL